MSIQYQNNKDFVESAGIAEQDAYLAVALRRIVAKMTEIPARELTSETTFEKIMSSKKEWTTDWDALVFAMEIEEYFNININEEKYQCGLELAERAGYSNWFYNPDNCEPFDFLWIFVRFKKAEKKITFGEWVKVGIATVLAPIREEIVPPSDWPGLENSDRDSDAVVQKSLSHYTMSCICWTLVLIFAAFGWVVILPLLKK